MRFIRDTWTPVVAMELRSAGRFQSVKEAAEKLHLNRNGIREAAATGHRFGGYWWRYADMPANCQPLKRAKCVQVFREDDGKHFDGLVSVLREHHPDLRAGGPRDPKYHREFMRLMRAIDTGKPYEGKTYRRLLAIRPGTCVPERSAS